MPKILIILVLIAIVSKVLVIYFEERPRKKYLPVKDTYMSTEQRRYIIGELTKAKNFMITEGKYNTANSICDLIDSIYKSQLSDDEVIKINEIIGNLHSMKKHLELLL